MRIISAAVLAFAAVQPSAAAEHILDLDFWWTTDYAKQSCNTANLWLRDHRELLKAVSCDAITACPIMMPRAEACSVDPSTVISNFESTLVGRLAANPHCKGVLITQYSGPATDVSDAAREAIQKPHSSLIVDYVPGDKKQGWFLRMESGSTLTGEGDVAEISQAVCTIMTEGGGKIIK